MIKESDIFGGKQWSKQKQMEWEISSLAFEIRHTLSSYNKLTKKQEKELDNITNDFIDEILNYIKK